MLYEVVPTNKISISNIVEFPATLNLHRVPGGYAIDFDAVVIDDSYDLMRLEVETELEYGLLIRTFRDYVRNDDGHKVFKVYSKIPYDRVKDHDHINVTLRGWARQRDEVYNALVLNPFDDKADRMSKKFDLSASAEGYVLGVRMPDWMWWFFRDDIKMAAFVWTLFFIIVFIGIAIGVVFHFNQKYSRFSPPNSDIRLKVQK